MKKSYIRMLIFQFIIFSVFFLNSFISNILGGYNFVLFLVVGLIAFKFIFGFEKDRHRYTKDIIFEVIIFLLSFFVLFYLFGVIISFAKTNYLNWYGLKTFIIPSFLTIVLKEVLRYMMLKKSEGSNILLVTTVILFIFLDVTEAIYYNSFNTNYNMFIFVALTLLPAISNNIICSYITKQTGYKPVILFLLVTELYGYIMPIIPNPNEYFSALIQLILPVALGYKIHNFLEKEKDRDIDRDYNKKRVHYLLLPTLLTVVIVYFTSGYFSYYALAIASGSMHPSIKKGDVVIVKKIEKNYDKIKKGQVLAHEYNGVIVVHRIEKIVESGGHYYYYTKGDANSSSDNYAIDESMVVGTVSVTIPFAGYPTIWLNE